MRQGPLRDILDGMGVFVALISSKGTILEVNRAMLDATGLQRDGVVGRRLWEVGLWDDGDEARRAVLRAVRGGPVRCDLVMRLGKPKTVDTTFTPLSDCDGQAKQIVLSAVDVTERRATEDALRVSEELNRRLVEAVPGAILEVSRTGAIRFSNAEAERLLRLSSNGGDPPSFFELPLRWEGADGKRPAHHPVTRCLRSGQPQPPTTVGIAHDSEPMRWAVFRAIPLKAPATQVLTGAVVTFFEITERVRMERALAISEARLEEAQRVAALGHWDWNVETNDLAWSNQIYSIFGVEPRSFQPTYPAFLSLVHPQDRQSVVEAVDRAVRGLETYSIDHRIVWPSGEVRVVHEQGEVTRDSSGKAVRMLGIVQDITERKAVEEELRRSVDEKSVLLKEVHHRVKNNLQIISSLLYFQARASGQESTRQHFEESQGRVRTMALLHEMLYQSGDIGNVDLRRYVKNLTTALVGSYKDLLGRVRIETAVDAVSLDIERAVPCGLIINELVTNALKYAFPASRSGTVRIEFSRVNGVCRLTVGDNGIGLPSGTELTSSSSLGLRLVRTLAEQLSAVIEVQREEGTKFTLCFT